MQTAKECYFCKTTQNLQRHHVFEGSRRHVSEELGLVVWLCMEHHTGKSGVHHNEKLNQRLKKEVQEWYLQNHSLEEWMKKVGKNYGS